MTVYVSPLPDGTVEIRARMESGDPGRETIGEMFVELSGADDQFYGVPIAWWRAHPGAVSLEAAMAEHGLEARADGSIGPVGGGAAG